MNQSNLTAGATPEEILTALAALGEDPNVTRVQAVRAKLVGQVLPAGGRDEAVRQAVEDARQLIDAEGKMPKNSPIASVAVRFRYFDTAALEEHLESLGVGPLSLTNERLEKALVNPSTHPSKVGYEIKQSDVTHIEGDQYTLVLSAHVFDEIRFGAEAAEEYARCWGNGPDHPMTLEEQLYEIAVASNANPSPTDIGVELIDWKRLGFLSQDFPHRQGPSPVVAESGPAHESPRMSM